MNLVTFLFFGFLQFSPLLHIAGYITGDFGSSSTVSAFADGRLGLLNGKDNTLSIFTSELNRTSVIGGKGFGNFEFDFPSDISSSFLLEVFIVDQNNRRILVYDRDMNFTRSYADETLQNLRGRFYPVACSVSPEGDLFVVEKDENRILKISSRLTVGLEFGLYKDGKGALRNPKAITVTEEKKVIVLDNNRLLIFDLFGNYLAEYALPNNQIWNSLVAENKMLLLSSSKTILLLSGDLSHQSIVKTSDIIGFPATESVTDITTIDDQLYILTPISLLRCRISTQ